MLINLLVLCAIKRLLFDIIFNSNSSCKLIVQQWTVRSSDFLLALSTLQEIEDDTGAGPSKLDAFEDTRDVENMAAADLDTGALVVTLGVANGAVVVSVLAHSQPFVFLHTLRI
jgi:hypothetical protein